MSIIESKLLELEKYKHLDDVKEQKINYFKQLFKSSKTNIQCNHLILSNYFKNLYSKYPKKQQYKNFMSECMSYTFEAIMNFDVKDSGNWQGIIDGTDKANTGRLITYIKNTVGKKIYREVINDGKLFTRSEVNGKKGQHIMLELNIFSLDTKISDDDGKEVRLDEIVSNEQNFVYSVYSFYWNFFLDWFNQKKYKILTKNQLNYIENGYIPCSKKNKRIREKVLAKWEEENPLGKKTLVESYKEKEIELWNEMLQIIHDESIDLIDVNGAVSHWIVENLDNEIVGNLVYDSLSSGDCKHVVMAYKGFKHIPNKVLYKLINAVDKRIMALNRCEIKSVKFYKKKHEIGQWDLKKHMEYEQYVEDFKNQKCICYFDGQVYKELEADYDKSENVNLFVMTPEGVEIQQTM